MDFKAFARTWLPPGVVGMLRQALDHVRQAPFEYVPDGWARRIGTRGWDVPSVAKTQETNWKTFVQRVSGPGALTINHEAQGGPNSEIRALRDHNTVMCFAYVLALASHRKGKISLLDWGGGMGHYYVLSHALLPNVEIEYYCQDLPLLCEAGKKILPQAHFFDKPDACFDRTYDLAIASSSLFYQQDWEGVAKKLVACTREYLYLSRMLFVERASSFVALQRPWAVGYDTEYLFWVFNKEQFLGFLKGLGVRLVREFFLSDGPHIHRAPEKAMFQGYLFRRPN